jgi:rod shape-determining protein MreC
MIRELLQRHQRRLLLGTVLLLPLVSMYVHGKERSATTLAERALLRLTGPLAAGTDAALAAVVGVWTGYIDLIDVRARNRTLEQQNRELLGEALRSRALAEELGRVKQLCDFRGARRELETVPARVIGREVSQFFRVLRIRLEVEGAAQVREGQAVVTHDGVVGRVDKVAGPYADVMLITDARSAAHATVAGKGVVGTARGKGKGKEFGAEFVYLDRAEERAAVAPGDAVLTTGHDRVFPAGLEIGHVTAAPPTRSGPYFEFTLTPAVTFATLEEVLIVVRHTAAARDLPAPEARRRGRQRVDPANTPDG